MMTMRPTRRVGRPSGRGVGVVEFLVASLLIVLALVSASQALVSSERSLAKVRSTDASSVLASSILDQAALFECQLFSHPQWGETSSSRCETNIYPGQGLSYGGDMVFSTNLPPGCQVTTPGCFRATATLTSQWQDLDQYTAPGALPVCPSANPLGQPDLLQRRLSLSWTERGQTFSASYQTAQTPSRSPLFVERSLRVMSISAPAGSPVIVTQTGLRPMIRVASACTGDQASPGGEALFPFLPVSGVYSVQVLPASAMTSPSALLSSVAAGPVWSRTVDIKSAACLTPGILLVNQGGLVCKGGGQAVSPPSSVPSGTFAAPLMVIPPGGSDDLIYCHRPVDCAGLTPPVSSSEVWRFAFVAEANAQYQVRVLQASASTNPNDWFGSSARTPGFSGGKAGLVLLPTSGLSASPLTGADHLQVVNSTSSPLTGVFQMSGLLTETPLFAKVERLSGPVNAGGVPVSPPSVTDVLGVYVNAQTSQFVAPGNGQIDYLVIGGGGSGGQGHSSAYGGSGGAGGYRTSAGTSGGGGPAESKLEVLQGASYTVVVGRGGSARVTLDGVNGNNGLNSSLGSITAVGGGAGSGTSANQPAQVGGSGGGGSYLNNPSGANGTAGQGSRGGNYNTGGQAGFGGGAANAASLSAPGSGLASTITGTSVVRAAGGGPAGSAAPPNNLGSGGSGGRRMEVSNGPLSTSGSSGLVVIRYQAVR